MDFWEQKVQKNENNEEKMHILTHKNLENPVRIPHPLPKNHQPHLWLVIFYHRMGFEEDGRAKRGKKYAGGMFFSPGENPWIAERTRYGCEQ